jgi:hypothetical protein
MDSPHFTHVVAWTEDNFALAVQEVRHMRRFPSGSRQETSLKRQSDEPKELQVFLAKLPKDSYSLAGLALCCLTIILGTVLAVTLTPPGGKTQIGVSEFQITASGSSILSPQGTDTRLLEFWTPSEYTRLSLCGPDPDKPANFDPQKGAGICQGICEKNPKLLAQDKWECSVTEKDVPKFEKELWKKFHCMDTEPCNLDKGVGPLSGLHRYREEGIGYSGLRKAGWWWEVNVDKAFDLKEFAKFYVNQWCNGRETNLVRECKAKPVYVEEINGAGGYKTGP